MDQRRRALAERNNGCPALDGKKIEPTPNAAIPALRHCLQIGPREMGDLYVDLKDALTRRTPKDDLRRRLRAALWATQRANNPHILPLGI
jgi:hypothetical protein